ncbi:MAG: EamA family transporter [Saprospiraceae bacterium]|nr:EamA family transporter [Saprospiraceae bacterium]MCB9322592.1 EamA family transporter [Lewinellaceae bacterium]
MNISNTHKAHLALLAVSFIYGVNYLIAKGIMPDKIGASALVFIRITGAGSLFWMIKVFFYERVERKDMGRLMLCGLLGAAANQLLFFNGLSLTSPIDASIIMTATPVFVLIISAILLKETITFQKIAGLLVGALGAILLIYAGVASKGTGTLLGNSLVLMNSLAFSFYLVIVKPLMKKYKPITVLSWVFFFGFVFMVPFAIKQFIETDFAGFTTGTVLVIFFVVMGPTFLAYLFNIYASKHLLPSVSGSYIYLQPAISFIVVSIYSFWLHVDTYKDDISLLKIACCVLVIMGVYLISSKPLPMFKQRMAEKKITI